MRVQDAPDITVGNETGYFMRFCEFDFIQALAQLRLDELQTERGVNLFLLSRYNFATDVQALFIQGHSVLNREFAQLLYVLL